MKKPFKVTKPEDFFREILIDRSEEQFDFEIKKIASYRTYHFRVFFLSVCSEKLDSARSAMRRRRTEMDG